MNALHIEGRIWQTKNNLKTRDGWGRTESMLIRE
jgi:hypothetical protein